VEIKQQSWRGRELSFIKKPGEGCVVLNGVKSLLSIPVVVSQNTKYKIILEIKKESGNGILFCNLFGNRNFDFPAVEIETQNELWKKKEFVLSTGKFPNVLPIALRFWRGPKGNGKVCIKKIYVEFIESDSNIENKIKIEEDSDKIKESEFGIVEGLLDNLIKESDFVSNKFVKLFNGSGVKVLYLPLNNREVQQTGMEDAFVNNNVKLCSYDFYTHFTLKPKESNLFLIALANWFRPDFIHMQLQDTKAVLPETLKTIKRNLPNVYISNWTGDIRTEPIDYFIKVSKETDLSLISSVGQLELYKSAGCKNVDYWQIGYDPKFFYRKSDFERTELGKKYNHDIIFCGNKIGWAKFPGTDLRQKTLSLFNDAFGKKFCAYGAGYSCSRGSLNFFKQNEVCNSAKIILSINHFNDVELYFSDRQLVSMASGTLTLSKYIPGLEKYFENKKDLVWFNTEEEALELAKYYLDHPEEAEEIGKNGAKKVLEEHTYFCKAKELLEKVPIKRNIDMSVVLGTFNRIKTLKNSIESIFSSANGKNIEVIVNDAGSTDGTKEWLIEQKKNKNIVTIFSNGKSSITDAYNECFKIAKGKYVTWLSDDILAVGAAIENMCNVMDTLGEKDMGAFLIKNFPHESFHMTYFLEKLCPVVGCMQLNTLKKYNYFNTDYLYYAQDLEINSMVLRMGGRIIESTACLNHINISDTLKSENVNKFIKSGNQHKFNLVNRRYGVFTGEVFPSICMRVIGETSEEEIKNNFTKLNAYYKNANYYLENSNCVLEGIRSVKDFDESNFDLVVNIFKNKMEVVKPEDYNAGFVNQICK